MGIFHTELMADKIIEYVQPKLIGQNIIVNGEEIPIIDLYKDGANDRYKVMVGTNTPHTEEIKDFLYSLMWMDVIDKFDWDLGEEK
jgi:hypothetical protein